MSVFDVDFTEGGMPSQYTPVRLRTPNRLQWLAVLLSAVNYTYQQFTANRANDLYVLAHTSCVTHIEAVLNDVFDNTLRRIFISDPPYFDPVYLVQPDEDKPAYLATPAEVGGTAYPSPLYLFQPEEIYAAGGVQFIVNVPVAVAGEPIYDVNRLRALVDKYRLASKNNYTVVTF